MLSEDLPPKQGAVPYSQIVQPTRRNEGEGDTSTRVGFRPSLRPDALGECLILAWRGDSLAALIKSKELANLQRQDITLLCQEESETLDAKLSAVIASEPIWAVRRKRRNAKRRLLIALLVKYCDYSLDDLKGAKYHLLTDLAQAKGLANQLPYSSTK